MKSLQDYLSKEQAPTIHTLVKFMNQYLSEKWNGIFAENEEELAAMFAEYGDRAYGAYVQKLMAPVCEPLLDAGFQIRPGFHLSDSIEQWGPPEERERCAWYVIAKDGDPIGTAVLQFYHSHTRFHLPQPPRFFALEETGRDEILNALSHAAVRLYGSALRYQDSLPEDGAPKWEYAADSGLGDYLQPFKGQTGTGFIDQALAVWGRNGWELVSITPYQDRLVGFFKRPAR